VKVALVHDWLTGTRGGEKVLLELVRLFPGAPVFTLFHFPGSVPEGIEEREIKTTFLQRLVSKDRNYRKLLPLFFVAAETWDLSGFDLVVSTSHCVAKNARRGAGAFHFCYCHTPVRYLHDQFDAYFLEASPPVRMAARLARAPLAALDVRTSRRVDAFVANSENVRLRIERLYGRPAEVVYPPADIGFYTPPLSGEGRSGFLIVSALAPYKRLEDAIRAANSRNLPLSIAGFGPEESRLRKMAGPTVTFLGTPSDEELRRLYRSARAVLMPGEEDFGIVPVEAQACGTPVIALGQGGAKETVRDGQTGILYPSPGPESLILALERFETVSFDTAVLRSNAEKFSPSRFRESFSKALAGSLLRFSPELHEMWMRRQTAESEGKVRTT
jgi:glycosyltransferase involved in cell wall biosynthesis